MQLRRERGSDYLVKVRVLRKAIDWGGVQTDDTSPVPVVSAANTGWEIVEGLAGTKAAVWKGYIDLAGYTREDQTWFTRNVQIQGAAYPANFTASITLNVPVYDIVSEVPLTDVELAYCNGLTYPGSVATGMETNLQQIIFGRIRTYSTQTTLGGGNGTAMLVSEEFFGLNNGTTRDKLYIYKVIGQVQLLGADEAVVVGATHFVLSGAVDKEPDLEYIMRTKRSYEQSGPFS